ncbi:MAG: DUF4236 domain-containing protein [Prevotella sp.]|nr:DUF4236 domain-containing protein [Prevotella sp.]
MPTYIRKSIKILPWVTLNINKTGMSLSIGPRGAKLNISKKGAYINSNIRGTGIYNKTKVSTCLLWGLGVCVAVGAIGYVLGIALQNFNLFVIMCGVAIVAGIAAFFISKKITKPAVEEMEEDELPEESSSTRKKATKKTATTKGNSAARQRTSTRTDKAPAKAYIGEVERLLEEMANAETVEELDKCHNEILDIMYTNIKPLGVKVMDMDFKDAMSAIEKEYSAGLQQLRS